MMRALLAGAWATAAVAAPGLALAQGGAEKMPLDRTTTVQGVETACTGLGKTQRDNPAWESFSVRVEFADAKAEYLTDAEVMVVTAQGKPVLHVSCAAPWVLMRLPPGDYRVSGHLLAGGPERSAAFKAPRTGQASVALTFPSD
jgi:hypothetical protein